MKVKRRHTVQQKQLLDHNGPVRTEVAVPELLQTHLDATGHQKRWDLELECWICDTCWTPEKSAADSSNLEDPSAPSEVSEPTDTVTHAPDDWVADVRTFVLLLPSGHSFIADDVWEKVPSIPEPRALGGILLSLRKDGAIRKTGQFLPSRRRKGAPVQQWQRTEHAL